MQIRSASNTNEVNWDDPLNKGLVAWYPFKQKGGNVLRDVAGNFDGNLQSSMTSDDWVTSPETKSLALDLDGADDHVDCGTGTFGILPGSYEMTLSAWCKVRTFEDFPTILSKTSVAAPYGGWQLNVESTGRFYLGFNQSGAWTILATSSVFNTNEWYLVTATRWNGGHSIFVNGTLEGQGSGSGTIEYSNAADPVLIGRNGARSETLDGQVSDVRIYNRALSAAEVHDLYQASRTGYVDQFKRRYFPVSLPTEEPPTETATSGLIRLKSPKQTQPSYKAGYAKSASESASPELWDGLVGAWVSNLGDTGRTLKDVTGRAEDGYDTNNFLTRVMTKSGPATYMNKDGDRSFYSLGSVDVGITTQATWVYDAEIISYSSNGTMWDWDSSGTYDTWAQLVDSGSKVRWGLTTDSGRVFLDTTSAAGTGDKILVFRWDGSEMTIWANGVKAATGSHSGLFADSTGNHRIGGASGNEGAHANFRSLLVYNRAISDDEIQDLHADPLAPFRQRRYAPFSLTTEEPPTTFNHWYALPGRIHRFIGLGVHV